MIQIVSPGRFIVFIVVSLLAILAILYVVGWGGPARIMKGGDVTIADGDTAGVIYQHLVEGGYFDHTLPWRYYIWRFKAGSKLQAGSYHLEVGESLGSVVRRLAAGEIADTKKNITFPEGFTLAQIAARTAAKGIGTEADFKTAAVPENYATQYPHLASLPKNRTLEGYLFPDTYHIMPDDEPSDVITRLLANFDTKFTADLRSEAQRAGRSLDQIVIMASILEREVIHDEDMALVAGVLWKRFDEGRGLAADATIRYALDKWDGALTVTDLAVDSLYNTRRYPGLPPGPISNPGLRALTAAVRPTESDYYYYLSTPEGETIFAKTNDEHNANKAKYLR